MGKILLDTETLRFANLFQTVTGASLKDCIMTNNKITFIVKPGNGGKAIGRKGANVIQLQNKLNRKVEIVEFSNDIIHFATKILHPAKLTNCYISEDSIGNKILNITAETDKGLVKSKMKRALSLIQRYYEISHIRLG